MSKKKRQNPIPAAAAVEAKKTPLSAPSRFSPKLIFGAIALLIVAGLAFYFLYFKNAPKQTNRPVGIVTGCQQIPAFVRSLNFGNKAAFSTSDRQLPGLVLIEGDRKYQHPTWKTAGSLAPITRDGKGGTFAAPAPMIDVLKNKPDEQNKIYRVDGQTQEMTQFADLPKAAPATSQNPFGVLGLTFDCDTNSLYATSVFGSSRTETSGQIFQISPTGAVLSKLEKTDAVGVSVFNSAKGKRLYFGNARNSEIWSIALDDKGGFAGEARKEISLESLGARGDDKARRINFTAQNEMIVFGIEFGFNLIAPTEKQETIYRFRYDTAKDAWNYVSEPPQVVGDSGANSQP